MTHHFSFMPACTAAGAVALALLAGGAAQAAGASQSFSASFTAAGGDASFGYGATADPTFNLEVYDLLPLFDPALGVLERVNFSLQGWRSFEGVCSVPAGAQSGGGCSARIDGAFFLDGLNLNTWPQAAALGSINPVTLDFTGAAPGVGQSLPISIYASASTAGEVTDPVALASIFTDSGLPHHGIRLRFSPQDGGYFGYGGSAGYSAMLWDADATATVTYHYAAVPEPGSWALMLAGLAMLGRLGRLARRPS